MRQSVFGTLAFMLWCSVAVAQSSAQQTHAYQVQHLPGAYVEVNGAKLWYEIEGKGEPLLLISGGPGMDHTGFHTFFSALADSFRVVHFDAFGRGKSDRAKSPAEYTFKRDVDDIEGLRKALGLGKIVVLGHSYGGMVAQGYALKYPSSVSKLILVCTIFSAEMWQAVNDSWNYEIRNQFPEVWQQIQEVRAKGLNSSAPEHQKVYAVPLGLLCFYDASAAQKLPPYAEGMNPDVFYAIAGDDADFLIGGDLAALDFRRQLKDLQMPTLIIAGRFDRLALPRYSLEFRKYAPQAQFVMFEHSGHFPLIEEPDKFIALLRSFLGAALQAASQH